MQNFTNVKVKQKPVRVFRLNDKTGKDINCESLIFVNRLSFPCHQEGHESVFRPRRQRRMVKSKTGDLGRRMLLSQVFSVRMACLIQMSHVRASRRGPLLLRQLWVLTTRMRKIAAKELPNRKKTNSVLNGKLGKLIRTGTFSSHAKKNIKVSAVLRG